MAPPNGPRAEVPLVCRLRRLVPYCERSHRGQDGRNRPSMRSDPGESLVGASTISVSATRVAKTLARVIVRVLVVDHASDAILDLGSC